jgi:hypothetical protein
MPARIQAIGPGSESVLVATWHWQCGHTMLTLCGPKLGALTYCTMTGTAVGAAGGGAEEDEPKDKRKGHVAATIDQSNKM